MKELNNATYRVVPQANQAVVMANIRRWLNARREQQSAGVRRQHERVLATGRWADAFSRVYQPPRHDW